MATKGYTKQVSQEDPELLEGRERGNGLRCEKGRIGILAAVALACSLLVLGALLPGARSRDASVSFRAFLDDPSVAEAVASNAATWASRGASAPREDVATHVRELADLSARKAAPLSRAMDEVQLSPEEQRRTLRVLWRLGETRSVAAGRALHAALDTTGLDGDVLAKLTDNVRQAMLPHSETIRGLRAEVGQGQGGAPVNGHTEPERLRAVRAVRARLRIGAAPQRTRRGDADSASLVRDQLIALFAMHAGKFDQALWRPGAHDEDVGRRLFSSKVYTICADPGADASGCDLCPVNGGEMPEGCKADQPGSCACTFGVFANVPPGQIPKDPQQGPVGCDPNCEQVGSFMQCYSGDAKTRAGKGGMPLTECMEQMMTGYFHTPISNLMNDIADPFFGDHSH